MPSARELLEQADALMRRNRSRETLSPAMGPRTTTPTISGRKTLAAPGDFPVLTEALETPGHFAPPPSPSPRRTFDAPSTPEPVVDMRMRVPPPQTQPTSAQVPAQSAPAAERFVQSAPAAEASVPSAPPRGTVQPAEAGVAHSAASVATAAQARSDAEQGAADAPRPFARAYNDVPLLTDAIADIDAALMAEAADGEPSIWNDDALRGDDSVLGPSPKSIAVIPEAREIDASRQRNAAAAAAAEAEAASAVAASTAELIDEVRMQVLQRIDMFTDTGLRDQLGERLKPIVDRASAELVATINQHVGELLRTYVAEAIERELDRLRNELR